jgi:hypothetical protein
MTTEFVDAVRRDINLLILLAGGTGSGKTESAMRLATGLAGGQPFAVIDTENGRALHKADDYRFKHAPLDEPFTPERYAEMVKAADDAGFPVIVIDSGSHEWEGIGGVLDMQTAEFERMGSRDAARMASWIEPKSRHKRFVQALLRTKAHVILCLRAEDKVEMVKVNGKTEVRAKESLIGTQGWIPIVEKRLPFEATISLLLLQTNPGVPVPIKLERRHADLVFTDVPLDEATGERLAAWAKGSGAEPSPTAAKAAGGAGGRGTQPAPSAPVEPAASLSPSPDTDSQGDAAAPKIITQGQRARLFAIGREYGVGKDEMRGLVEALTGTASTAELSVEHYETLVALIQSRTPVNA